MTSSLSLFILMHETAAAATTTISSETAKAQLRRTITVALALFAVDGIIFGKTLSSTNMEKYNVICRAAALISMNVFHYFL